MPAFFRLALTTLAVKSLLPNFPHNPLVSVKYGIYASHTQKCPVFTIYADWFNYWSERQSCAVCVYTDRRLDISKLRITHSQIIYFLELYFLEQGCICHLAPPIE